MAKIAHARLMTWHLTRPWRGQRGASLVEYTLLIALIALVCIAAVTTFGQGVSRPYSSATSGLG